MSYLTRTNAGALALTFASIILLSGLWCIYLSPTMPQHISKLFRQENTILGAESSATYDVEVQEQDKLTIQIHNVWFENYTLPEFSLVGTAPEPRVHVSLLDTLDLVIWAEEYVLHTSFSMGLASGFYTLEIVNAHDNADVRVFFTISVSGNVDYRPLQPFGLWLILVSFPIGGLGIWWGKDKSRKE